MVIRVANTLQSRDIVRFHPVAAFRSTLEEVTESDFIVHVVDVSHPAWETQRDAVLETLVALGADSKPAITIFNKIDRLDDPTLLRALVAECQLEVPASLPPMCGGLVGYLGYDMARRIERLPDANPEVLGVPEAIVWKTPTADLWVGQSDEVELGYRYADLDRLLVLLVDHRATAAEAVRLLVMEVCWHMIDSAV